MNGPLEGVKIIDLTSMISGPSATMILADQGAQVVKIENILMGDYTRIVNTEEVVFRRLLSITTEIKNPFVST